MTTPAELLTGRLGGRWRGSYGEACCPVHDDRSPSLSIRDGERAPLVKCHSGCDRRDIVSALRRAGIWPDDRDLRSRLHAVPDRRAREDRTLRYLRAVWRESLPIVDTPAERYLRNRGIHRELPPSLRYHPGLKHTDTGLMLPCTVAAVQAPDRSISGLHRTFLRSDGVDKAPVTRPKKMLGKVAGGAVRLAAAEAELAIGEGIETCLSFQQATSIATWAALSTSGMTAIALPPLPIAATVYLLVDLDPAGEEAARTTADRLIREGRAVKLARPVAGKDFNDALRGTSHAR
jgi:putative DNA primase/helicase